MPRMHEVATILGALLLTACGATGFTSSDSKASGKGSGSNAKPSADETSGSEDDDDDDDGAKGGSSGAAGGKDSGSNAGGSGSVAGSATSANGETMSGGATTDAASPGTGTDTSSATATLKFEESVAGNPLCNIAAHAHLPSGEVARFDWQKNAATSPFKAPLAIAISHNCAGLAPSKQEIHVNGTEATVLFDVKVTITNVGTADLRFPHLLFGDNNESIGLGTFCRLNAVPYIPCATNLTPAASCTIDMPTGWVRSVGAVPGYEVQQLGAFALDGDQILVTNDVPKCLLQPGTFP